ncbi:alpha/beta-hydrolase [Trichodelitschia bisporula]|uniref:Alpha/beta-hydrolase n=1 Tax=Trichodelitschia bisporula TaxID=703511 RepID=A0A6G1HMR4_9PEZI|nr:alpha/beta-hydrolase [Trichodelitschia bisporula]
MRHSLLRFAVLLFAFNFSSVYGQNPSLMFPIQPPSMEFSRTWLLLGPFQIGTREAAWGADPLEYYGGFTGITPNDNATFPSSLAPNGFLGWSSIDAKGLENNSSTSKVSIHVHFPGIDWAFLQSIYGWAALQYQAWVRGELVIHGGPQAVVLYTDGVLECSVDGIRHFGGDFYSFRKAPLVLNLDSGRHVLDLRLVRDVRAMGGIGDPTIEVHLEAKTVTTQLEADLERVLVSDVVDGRLPSPYGSVVVRNHGESWIDIVGISTLDVETDAKLLSNMSIGIAPGQTRPVAFRLSINGAAPTARTIALQYKSKAQTDPGIVHLEFIIKLTERSAYEPHKVTHLHPSGIVSYAILRPPSPNCTALPEGKAAAPVLLQLHGAGLEADSTPVAHALDPVPDICAWVIFPTGVTPWSSDDWHTWGFSDVEAAITNIPSWIDATGWSGIGVDVDRWFVSGHSNGGQGTWYTLTHWPDKVLAAAPVSGYLSIHSYVPYQFWLPMDPHRRAIIEASANSFRHELLASNGKGIPILQQHGDQDDNVPAYHSRFMHHLLEQAGWRSTYNELAGKGHWFDGVMTTEALKDFYREHLTPSSPSPEAMLDFELVVANPGDTGSKGGVRVTHLKDAGRLGKMFVNADRNTGSWVVRTDNVLAFEMEKMLFPVVDLVVDGQRIVVPSSAKNGEVHSTVALQRRAGLWDFAALSRSDGLRRPDHMGGIHAILRSKGRFEVVHHGPETFRIALQISRNLHQYYAADTEISSRASRGGEADGNIITVAVGHHLPESHDEFPLQVNIKTSPPHLMVRDEEGRWREYGGRNRELCSAIFIRPTAVGKLELVVWGASLPALEDAARLAPTTTGVGQPDFILLDGRSRWSGVEGASLGFFDSYWNVSGSSLVS